MSKSLVTSRYKIVSYDPSKAPPGSCQIAVQLPYDADTARKIQDELVAFLKSVISALDLEVRKVFVTVADQHHGLTLPNDNLLDATHKFSEEDYEAQPFVGIRVQMKVTKSGEEWLSDEPTEKAEEAFKDLEKKIEAKAEEIFKKHKVKEHPRVVVQNRDGDSYDNHGMC